jgi:microcystin-dependent protein
LSTPFVAEIRIFPFNFAPTGWAFCDGQLLPISQNTALFSLVGTTYGGDGQSTFALPNLQGCVPLHQGQGPGLSLYSLGQQDGVETVTLLTSEMPAHTHQLRGQSALGDSPGPKATTVLGRFTSGYQSNTGTLVPMAPESLPPAGGGQPHNNLMPYLTFNFCIAMQGVFPPRP